MEEEYIDEGDEEFACETFPITSLFSKLVAVPLNRFDQLANHGPVPKGLWFVAQDVIEVLGVYTAVPQGPEHVRSKPPGTGAALKAIGEEDRIKLTYAEAKALDLHHKASRASGLILIPERVVYKLILRANRKGNPMAAEFQDWVTDVILPDYRSRLVP